jgi:hypothetical protein
MELLTVLFTVSSPGAKMVTVPLPVGPPRVRFLAVSPLVVTSAVPPLLMNASSAAVGSRTYLKIV